MNPFNTLGIAPEIVRDLKDEQLLKHIKAVYRSLSLLFHPDTGGTDKMAKELNIAMHELENPERFLAAKNDYIKKKLTKSQDILRIEKKLAEKDKKLTTFKEECEKNSWQFLGNNRKMSLVPNEEVYLLLDPFTIVHLSSYSPAVDVYDVFDGKFIKLTPVIFGFINTELMREKTEIKHSAYQFLKGKECDINSEIVTLDEESFKKNRALFLCTDIMNGSEFVVYDKEKQQYTIIGKVMKSSSRLENVLEKYSEKIIRALHTVDKESPWKHFQLIIESAKKIGCKDHRDFSSFLGELSQIVKIFQSYRSKKTREETMSMAEEVFKIKTYSWHWFSGTIKEIATEYLMAGKSSNGLVAIAEIIKKGKS